MRIDQVIPKIADNQADLARLLNVSPTSVHRWKQTGFLPEAKAARLAAMFPDDLSYSPDFYVSGTESPILSVSQEESTKNTEGV